MAVTMADISKLRQMTGAGMMDCKKALTEANNDMDAAIEILRKKGQAVAAKREDRNASEGCVIAQSTGEYAAVVALNCETDFVGKNEGFVNLTKSILAAAVAAKAKSADEVKALVIDGQTVADRIVEESGKTGEKMELGAFEYVEGPATIAYNHFGNKLATLVSFNKAGLDEQVYKNVAMQVAGAATERSYPMSEVRGSSREKLPHARGQGRRPRGATRHPRSGSCTGKGGLRAATHVQGQEGRR